MKLASYKSTRPGIQGLFNRLIRWRLDGIYSHTEIVFEPDDAVGNLMPDGTCEMINGTLWCASSVAAEAMPIYSTFRKGKHGGVRFKRIELDPKKWDFVKLDRFSSQKAAAWFFIRQGSLYDYSLISKYLFFFLSESFNRYTCSESCAFSLLFDDAWRFDPCILHSSVKRAL